MKKLLLLTCSVLCFALANAQPIIDPPPPPPPGSEEEVITFVEEQPEFPGGQDAMNKYLSTNIRYPDMAKDCDCQGKVYITFVVDKDGSIIDATVVKGASCGTRVCYNATNGIVPCTSPDKTRDQIECDASSQLNKEALRVIKSMPKWKPGKQNGKPVKVKFTLPITFKLM